MNKDSKMRKIQQKYRNDIEFKSSKRKNGAEAVIIVFLFIFLLYFGTQFSVSEPGGIQPLQASDVEGNWMEVTIVIDDALKTSNKEYTGIAIDFNPKPIRIILKTSLKNTNLQGDDLNKLIGAANEYVVSNNLPALL
ncbi:hypothetical protein MHB63_16245 [Bacillus sp. FSL H8-0547]